MSSGPTLTNPDPRAPDAPRGQAAGPGTSPSGPAAAPISPYVARALERCALPITVRAVGDNSIRMHYGEAAASLIGDRAKRQNRCIVIGGAYEVAEATRAYLSLCAELLSAAPAGSCATPSGRSVAEVVE